MLSNHILFLRDEKALNATLLLKSVGPNLYSLNQFCTRHNRDSVTKYEHTPVFEDQQRMNVCIEKKLECLLLRCHCQ